MSDTENKLKSGEGSDASTCYDCEIKACQNCFSSVMPEDDYCYACRKSRDYTRPEKAHEDVLKIRGRLKKCDVGVDRLEDIASELGVSRALVAREVARVFLS